jgi:glutamate--cysteine ligase catalytic subunit
MEYLMEKGHLDQRLAFHVASLFVRDPIPAYTSEFEFETLKDSDTLAHFENL